jgi:hypothetical protein
MSESFFPKEKALMRVLATVLLLLAIPAGAHNISEQLCPDFRYVEAHLPGGPTVIAYDSRNLTSSPDTVLFAFADWGGTPKDDICISAVVHQHDSEDGSYLRMIDRTGGWRNASCPGKRCSLQFGISFEGASYALQAAGETFIRPVSATAIHESLGRMNPQYVAGGEPPVVVDPDSFAKECTNRWVPSRITFVLVGPASPEYLIHMVAILFNAPDVPVVVAELHEVHPVVYKCIESLPATAASYRQLNEVLKATGEESVGWNFESANACVAAGLMRSRIPH